MRAGFSETLRSADGEIRGNEILVKEVLDSLAGFPKGPPVHGA
jgi:hypothetical protein